MIVVGCALALASSGCRRDADMSCERVFERERYEVASVTCERAFERTGDVRDGIRAAKAHAKLGRDEVFLAWAERLRKAPPAATLWRMAARIHAKRDEHARAVEAHRRAADLYEAAGELGEASYHAYRLSEIHFRRSELLQALEQAERAYALAYRSDDQAMRRSAFTGLFVMLYDTGDERGARQLLRATRNTPVGRSPGLRPFMRLYEGLLHLDAGRHALARVAFTQGLEAALALEDLNTARLHRFNLVKCELALDNAGAAQAQLNAVAREVPADAPGYVLSARLYHQALVHQATGQHEAAEAALRRALAAEPIPDWAWRLAAELGRALEALGRSDEARAAYEQAIATIEAMRRDMQLDDFKAAMLDERRAPYEELFALHARAGHTREALAVAEQARARAFLDAFLHAAAEPGETAGSSEAVPGEGSTASGKGSTASTATYPVARARLSVVQFLAPVLTASPVMEPRPIDEVLAAMGDRHVLVYFQAGDAVWLYVHRGSAGRLLALPAPAAVIDQQIRDFLEAPDDPARAEALGAMLLPDEAFAAPVGAAKLRPAPVLHVVADGVLGRVPFAALRRKGRYVAQDVALAYVPSLTALAALARTSRDAGGPPVVLGVGQAGAGAEALPGALAEARAVAAALGVEAHTGARATIASLRGAAGASLLHVAAHGGVDASGAWLELADGRAHAGSILAWRVRPRVAVLASCASAVRHGKNMWGALGAAFLAAGSEAVVATLWSVEDAPTRRLVERYYAHGGAGAPARAVAAMQREALAAGVRPAQWAPFVVFGAVE